MIVLIPRDWVALRSLDTSAHLDGRRHGVWCLHRSLVKSLVGLVLLQILGWTSAIAQQPLQTLRNHVRPAVSDGRAALIGSMPMHQQLHMSIVLPLRNQAALTSLLGHLYDSNSPDFRHFLSVAQFTEQFGPTAEDYQAVVAFARSNGFAVSGSPANRLVVPIVGTVEQINKAFHVSMNVYQHPTEKRMFYSPDREPSLDLGVTVTRIAGLNDYSLPQPMVKKASSEQHLNAVVTGSGPGGSYLASDMRAAYYGGTTLTGNGQSVGLFEFGGFDLSDVYQTFSTAGQSFTVPINEVLLDGQTGAPGNDLGLEDDSEETLDIVQAIGMAPGLSQVRVYIGEIDADILNSMVSEDLTQQISCSWSWIPDSLTANDSFFQEMAAQGQSFFTSSGDSGAYDAALSPYYYPAEDQFVTAVGGTTLTTKGAGGSWVSETVWNDGDAGSGGGISPDGIGIPSWQTGLATAANGGSTAIRNVPDVAMEADFDNYVCALGSCAGTYAGTSFAAPRWAGFMALVNQQAVEANNAPMGGIGFLNPPLYALAQGVEATNDLHDIRVGNNETENQPVFYSATPGYDLTSGWGSAAGQGLIDDLAGPQVPGFWLASARGVIAENPGGTASTNITISDAAGFAGPVNLAVTSQLPAGVTASFSPNPTNGEALLTVSSSNTTPVGTNPMTITGTSGKLAASTQVSLAVQTPSFSLSATTVMSGRGAATMPSVNQGSSGTSKIDVIPLYGFTGSVTLAVSGLPSGVTATIAPNPATDTAQLKLTVSATATPGTTNLIITGMSGSTTSSTTASLTINGPKLVISSPGSLNIGQGMSGTILVDSQLFDGVTGSTNFSIAGLPNGVTASFSPNPSGSTLTLTASSNAVPGMYTLTVTGTVGTLTATTTIVLGVYAPTFTLTVLGLPTVQIGQGMASVVTLSVNDEYGFTGSVNLSVSGLPNGVTASFSPNQFPNQSGLTLTVANTAAFGQYPLTVIGTSGNQTSTVAITLVIAAPSFTLSTNYNSVFLGQVTSTNILVDVNSLFGFNGSVSFAVSGLPSGVTASFSPTPSSVGYSTLTLALSANAPPGQYPLTITGTSGTLMANTTLYIGIYVPSFTLGVPGLAFEVGQGSSATSSVIVYPQYGFTSAVSLSVSGLPSGVTAVFSPNPTTTDNSTMTVTASATAPVGLYTLTYTGQSAGQTVTAGGSLLVQAPYFDIGGGGASSIIQGSSTLVTLQVQPFLGFSGSVSFSVSGLPSGVTASFSPNPTTSASTMTLMASSSVPIGSYSLTVTGTSGASVSTTPLLLSVLAPTFAIASTSPGITIHQRGTGNAILYVSSPAQLPAGVILTASGLPAGVTASFSPNPTNLTSTMTLSASSSAQLGSGSVTVTGTCCGLMASTTIPFTVIGPQTATFTSLSLTANGGLVSSVPLGTVVTATATVNNGNASLNTGQVNFCDATAAFCDSIHLLGNAQLTNTGTAVLRFKPGIGGHSIKAVFVVSGGNAGSASAPSNLAVTASLPTNTTIAQSGSAGNYTLVATVSGGGATAPTGTISFMDVTNNNQQVAQAVLGTAPALFSTSLAQSLPVGENPQSVVTADFNGDGIPDMAVVNRLSDSISILLGNGDGTFQPDLNPVPVGSGSAPPLSAVTGDFNRDGNADIAVITNNHNIVLLLGNGDGTFTTMPLSLPSAAPPFWLVVADFNGDGVQDLAIANASGGSGFISILLGNGDGTFTSSTVAVPSVSSPADLVEADFNGDGIPDIAFVNSDPNTMVILLGNGDGTFVAQPATSLLADAAYMVAGDFNQDGKTDLFFGGTDGSTTLLGNGDGTFRSVPTGQPNLGTFPGQLVVADFDGDGKPDIAMLYQDVQAVYVMPGNGNGTFGIATSVALPAGSDPISIATGDWNGDGIPDLVTANSDGNSMASLVSQREQQVTATAIDVSPIGPGQHLVEASYPGDLDYSGSISGTTGLSGVNAQTINFPQPAAGTVGEQTTLVATASSGLPVTFSILTGPATLTGTDNATITFTGVGTVVIVASQTGNSTYAPATISDSVVVYSDSIWVLNSGAPPIVVSESGTGAVSSGPNPGSSSSGGIAFDAAGNAWYVAGGNYVYETNSAGLSNTFSNGGLSMPVAIAVDGTGDIWVANAGNGTVSEFLNNGTPITNRTGYSTTSSSSAAPASPLPSSIAIDSSGSIWIANKGSNTVTRIIGGAAPVSTPLSTAVSNGTVGSRP